MTGEKPSRDFVGSLGRGLVVLEILAAHPSGMTLAEMAAKAGLTRAGARRFLLTLVEAGYATQSGRLFSLSPKLLSVTRTWLGGTGLWSYAEPILRWVTEELGESCSASALSGDDVVYVARVPGPYIVMTDLHIGARLPAYCTSMGRVLLSGLPPQQLEAFLARARLAKRTPNTITDRGQLAGLIGKVAARGYAIVDEELELGLRSIAVPIHDRSGAIVAAINVSTQRDRFSVEDMEKTFLPVLLGAKHRVEDFFVLQ
ncbi:IclR family transcriptional regulator domain-containing protein [Chelatococcus asaccharovorans]|uniref:IclR family transcriptional regulator n=1 Tax=Chelatococcus asaccharovorans TaxID=28210 RepID=A0A2V3UI69_9HYPH|nr:IclR family transcriptional regulator C-terminal domain-containing protein [Chelatococcus asaccharovorans]MBS7701776.1 helix-turn-helix domain-containing protein [Chelatococcus asaccharovorans]PXW64517.1 IclR family transcriptional regulator [Chelatococcus asaccharovorans]CAH1665423.1 Pca regulon regulatory protein [Chelatococcus asaccharovorans]CAH1681961.1 Pca regulon regulatory protein [Chelatococcus asaccharovorans]